MKLNTNSSLWKFLALTFGYNDLNQDLWPQTNLELVFRTIKAMGLWIIAGFIGFTIMLTVIVIPAKSFWMMVAGQIPFGFTNEMFPFFLVSGAGFLFAAIFKYAEWRRANPIEPEDTPPSKIKIWWGQLLSKINKKIDYVDPNVKE